MNGVIAMQGSINERIRKKLRDANGKIRFNVKVYDVRYRYKDEATGENISTIKRGFTTKGDAEKFLVELNYNLERKSFVAPTIILVSDYLIDWIDSYVAVNLKRSTYLSYRRIVEKQIIPIIGGIDLKNLLPDNIDKMYAYLLKEGRSDNNGGLSAKTVLYIHRVLNEALEHAVKKRIIYNNPIKYITNTPKPKKFKAQIYNAKEILDLLKCTKDSIFELPVALAAICGLRRGECLALTIDDIDFQNMTININKQLNQYENELIITEPKSEDSNRVVSAPSEIFDIITKRIKNIERNKNLLESEYKDNKLIVCNEDGDFIKPGYFTKNFNRFLKRNNLKVIRFHDLRHSCASLMLKSGVPMKIASQILGHSTIGITADLYTHVLHESKKEAAELIGKELFG